MKPIQVIYTFGFPGGSAVKNPPANARDARDTDSIPELGRSPGEGNGNLRQYSCPENPMDRGAWWATVHGVAKSRTQRNDYAHAHLAYLFTPLCIKDFHYKV